MKIVALFLTGLIGLFGLTACGGSNDNNTKPVFSQSATPSANPTHNTDEAYLNFVYDNAPILVPARSDSFDDTLVEAAQSFCSVLDTGVTYDQFLDHEVAFAKGFYRGGGGAFTMDEAYATTATIAVAGVNFYCPQYSDMLNGSTSS